MKREEIVLVIVKSLPYASQITNLEFHDNGGVVFTWRGNTMVVNELLSVEEVDGKYLSSSDLAIIMQELFRKTNNTL